MKYGFPKMAKSGEDVAFKTIASAVYTNDGTTVQDHLNILNNISSGTNLSNLRLGLLGDGVSASGSISDPDKSFINLLGKHFASVTDYSQGGITVAVSEEPHEGRQIESMAISYASMTIDLDVILVYATTNDWFYDLPLGTIEDEGNTTYYGALKSLIDGLCTRYVDKDIFFIAPLARNHEGQVSPDTNNDDGHNLREYINVVKEVCTKHCIPVIDAYAECGMNIVYNDAHKAHYTINGVQLTEAGHYKMYKYLLGELSKRL